jgi:hypothetical protein
METLYDIPRTAETSLDADLGASPIDPIEWEAGREIRRRISLDRIPDAFYDISPTYARQTALVPVEAAA